MDLTLANVKQNSHIDEFIMQTEKKLTAMNYTDHGKRHINIVAERAQMLSRKVGFKKNEIEYSGIAGYCHDMGNFMGRDLHHHWASILFHQVFSNRTEDVEGIVAVMQAISNHDKERARLTNNITAALIIADKSEVHRDRVRVKDKGQIMEDIHNRVNYSVTRSDLDVNPSSKVITLLLELDTKITAVMDYFEIFIPRMKYCRTSAEYLGYKFKLVINDFEVL